MSILVLIFHLYNLIGKISSCLLSILLWIVWLFTDVISLYILGASTSLAIWFAKIFSWSVVCLPLLLTDSFAEQMFKFDDVQFIFFFLMDHIFGVRLKTLHSSLIPLSWIFSPIFFFSKSFKASYFTFKSMVHFEVIFV